MFLTASTGGSRLRLGRSFWAAALGVASLAAGPSACAEPHGSGLEASVDSTVAPGDDFFAYANGAWLKATSIPAGRERWGAREEIQARTREQVAAVLEQARTAPAESSARKLADFRVAYLDQATIDARGLAPLKPLFDSIDQVQDRTALTRFLGRGMQADVDPLNWGIYRSSQLLGLSVEEGNNGEPAYVAFLVQGGLGLPDRDNYISTEPAMVALRAKYQDYVGRMLALAGFDHADERAGGVVDLETAIARSQASREASAQDRNADNLWTRADFARRAPGMDWSAFFEAAGLSGQQQFIAWQPGAITGLAALVGSRPLSAWQDYLRFHALDHYADVLPHEFQEQARALRQAAGMTSAAEGSRADRAIAATQAAMGEALGRLYAERYFSAAQKARVRNVVANVVEAFLHRVEAANWMSPATKALALQKVRSLYIGIGYPERWQDYSDLNVDPRDALGNLQRAEARTYRHALARLGRPVDRTEWLMMPQMPGAILVFQLNAYDFTAALLQPPKFDSTASEAATYGAIGAIIGHDVTHYVDVLGAEYELDGRAHRWWTQEDSSRFQAVAAPLVDQFSAYHPFPDLAIDGQRTRTENVADLAGLAAAFDAYRATISDRINDQAFVRRQDREFFIAFAQGWRSRLTDSAMRAQVASDPHPPDRYRVAVVRNLDAWYKAFDVQPGQQLYLAPDKRVRIW